MFYKIFLTVSRKLYRLKDINGWTLSILINQKTSFQIATRMGGN